MFERRVIINNPTGLHARPAALFVQAASKFRSKITVYRDSRLADAKSIVGVMTLGARRGAELLLRAEGEDAELAIESLAGLIESGFGET